MSAREAVATAEQYAQMLLDKENLHRQTFPLFEGLCKAFTDSALNADAAPLSSDALEKVQHWATTHYGPRLWDELRFTGQEAAQRRIWQQHRIVYDIQPDLWAELGDTDTDTVLPVDLFTRLPHPNPFITFPEPLILPLDENTQQRVLGFFTRGHIDVQSADADLDRIQTSTTHPDVTALGLTFGGLVESHAGRPVTDTVGLRDVIWTRITLDPRVGRHTVGEMIDWTVSRFSGYTTEDYRDDVPRMIRRAVSLLVYLCATNADLTPLPRQSSAGTGKKAKGKTKGRKPSTVIGVGYRVGAHLAAYRKKERDEASEARQTGRHVAPHVRRAHFHTYKVGPGRQQSEIRWLSPIPVNMHGKDDPTTVISVRPQGTPARTRS